MPSTTKIGATLLTTMALLVIAGPASPATGSTDRDAGRQVAGIVQGDGGRQDPSPPVNDIKIGNRSQFSQT